MYPLHLQFISPQFLIVRLSDEDSVHRSRRCSEARRPCSSEGRRGAPPGFRLQAFEQTTTICLHTSMIFFTFKHPDSLSYRAVLLIAPNRPQIGYWIIALGAKIGNHGGRGA